MLYFQHNSILGPYDPKTAVIRVFVSSHLDVIAKCLEPEGSTSCHGRMGRSCCECSHSVPGRLRGRKSRQRAVSSSSGDHSLTGEIRIPSRATTFRLLNLPQDELRRVNEVVRAVEAPTEVSIQPLWRCESIIKELDQLITVKLVRRGNGSTRIRPRNWFRNRRHMIRLCDSLQKERKTLSEALSVDLLSVLMNLLSLHPL